MTPVVTIKNYSGSIAKDLQDGDYARARVDFSRIAAAINKMHETIRDLLELSRIGRVINPPMTIDTVQLIHDALDNVNARNRSSHVTVNIASEFPTLYGDRIRLREVFENLIANAAKYMGEQTNPAIEIGFRQQLGGTIIFVKDNGLGIDPQYHSRIFNLFEKLNPAIEGTGIGLALVKRIIETHGGKIWVESDGLGKGSTFCFTVPSQKG